MSLLLTWKIEAGQPLCILRQSGIDKELYEAARVDDTPRMKMIWHITIPCIFSTYFVLLMLNIANFLSNWNGTILRIPKCI